MITLIIITIVFMYVSICSLNPIIVVLSTVGGYIVGGLISMAIPVETTKTLEWQTNDFKIARTTDCCMYIEIDIGEMEVSKIIKKEDITIKDGERELRQYTKAGDENTWSYWFGMVDKEKQVYTMTLPSDELTITNNF